MDDFPRAAIGWDIDFRQLDAGMLDFGIAATALPDAVVFKVDCNRRSYQFWAPPAGMLTG